MAIEFVVETGARVDDANSYCTVDYFLQYWENRGINYELASTTVEPVLIKATQHIDSMRFKGEPLTLTQSLQWPRVYMVDPKGRSVNTDEIPTELKNAVCEAGKYIHENTNINDNKDNIKSKKISNISVTFFTAGESSAELQSMNYWLRTFLDRSGGVRV